MLGSIQKWKSTHEKILATDSSQLHSTWILFPLIPEGVYIFSVNIETVKLKFPRHGHSQSHLLVSFVLIDIYHCAMESGLLSDWEVRDVDTKPLRQGRELKLAS